MNIYLKVTFFYRASHPALSTPPPRTPLSLHSICWPYIVVVVFVFFLCQLFVSIMIALELLLMLLHIDSNCQFAKWQTALFVDLQFGNKLKKIYLQPDGLKTR